MYDRDYQPTVGDLVQYHADGHHKPSRSKITKVTEARVTLENGKVFHKRKYGRTWDFERVTQARLDYETAHAAWLAEKPTGKHASASYCSRLGISFQAGCRPEAVGLAISELLAFAAWSEREPQAPMIDTPTAIPSPKEPTT